MAANRILTVVTNVGEYEKVGYRTGLWLGELTHFLDAVEPSGFTCDIASPKGGYVPIDPESLMLQELGHAVGLGGPVHGRYEDRAFMDRLKDTMSTTKVTRSASGYSNKQIAARLKISVKTVETYKSRAMEKLGIRSRVDIVRYGAQSGWLSNS